MECFPFPKNAGRPLGMMNTVGIVLVLQAECVAEAIRSAAFSVSLEAGTLNAVGETANGRARVTII